MELIVLVGIAIALLVVIISLYLLQKKNASPGESEKRYNLPKGY